MPGSGITRKLDYGKAFFLFLLIFLICFQQVLQTLPFHKVHINIISIHLNHHFDEFPDDAEQYVKQLNKFMLSKSFRLKKQLLNNYIYQKSSIGGSRKL